ncbi:hypothetical protein PROFUN_14518 [Planoprotostelium fungivorum]|uniref:Uncharacterized protein n=1 Tax=Planoprotostelium fungivorum TaxID=1890364 RepID=A0A2P6MZP7_9EUKA|nr:hypothetical protein PROFUN_14518 [Planoprotostelium fungivorum]
MSIKPHLHWLRPFKLCSTARHLSLNLSTKKISKKKTGSTSLPSTVPTLRVHEHSERDLYRTSYDDSAG